MNTLTRIFHRAWPLAPLLSIVLVIALPVWLVHQPGAVGAPPVAEAESIFAAVNAAPYRIGRWVGAETPLPEAAGQQLRPTAALSRRYVNLDSGHAVAVSVIHSGDTRDMVGHHPPICFPSNGWIAAGNNGPSGAAGAHQQVTRIVVGETPIAVRRYEFAREAAWTNRQHIRVFNFFVLSDGEVTHDISHVHRRTHWMRANSQGVAQVQVLTQITMPEQDALDAAAELLVGLTSVFQAMGVNFHDQSQ